MFDGLRDLQGRAFDLDELVKAVNRQIGRAGFAPNDERVAAKLDGRTVRYYQTMGLASKPERYDGRQAIYGYQHLLQLVAIKALQAQGLSLGQIRSWLPDQPVAALQAALADSLAGPGGGRAGLSADAQSLRSPDRPEPHPDQELFPVAADGPVGLSAYRLAPGVTLLIEPGQVGDPAQLARRLGAHLEEGV